jgi:hypothetical protein
MKPSKQMKEFPISRAILPPARLFRAAFRDRLSSLKQETRVGEAEEGYNYHLGQVSLSFVGHY